MTDKPATEHDLLAIAQGQAEILGRAEAALIEARKVLQGLREDAARNRFLELNTHYVDATVSAIDRSLGEIAGSREVTKIGGDDAG